MHFMQTKTATFHKYSMITLREKCSNIIDRKNHLIIFKMHDWERFDFISGEKEMN